MRGGHGDLNFTQESQLHEQLDSTTHSYQEAVKKLLEEQTRTATLEAEKRISDLAIKNLEQRHDADIKMNNNLTDQITELMKHVSSLNEQIELLQEENKRLKMVRAEFDGLQTQLKSNTVKETVQYYDEDDDMQMKGIAYRGSGGIKWNPEY